MNRRHRCFFRSSLSPGDQVVVRYLYVRAAPKGDVHLLSVYIGFSMMPFETFLERDSALNLIISSTPKVIMTPLSRKTHRGLLYIYRENSGVGCSSPR